MSIFNSEKDPNSPATTSFEYDAMIGIWAMLDTLLSGTAAMRRAGRGGTFSVWMMKGGR